MLDIKAWLDGLGLGRYAEIFAANHIGSEKLSTLTSKELKEDLGIASLGHRKDILAAVKKLQLATLGELEACVVDSYPNLIAVPFRELLVQPDVVRKQKCIVDVLTNVLKYLALIVESEYLYSDVKDEATNELISGELGRPLVSTWNRFLKAGLPALQAAGHSFFMPELLPFFEKVESKVGKASVVIEGGYYNDDGDWIKTEGRLGWFTALTNFRNRFAHGPSRPLHEAERDFQRHYEILLQLLAEMAWCARYPMYKREHGRVYRLMGDVIATCELPNDAQRWDSSLVVGSPDRDDVLPLTPFFIVPSEYIDDREEGLELLIYDQNTGKRILYVSPQGHHKETTATIGRWRTLVEKKQVVFPLLGTEELNAEEIRRRCQLVSHATRNGLLRSRKIIDGAYVPRRDVEPHLRSWLGTIYPMLAVAAAAGGGKTNLLAHMAQEWAGNGHTVLFLRAAHIEGADFAEAMRAQLRLAPGLSPAEIARSGIDDAHRFVVVIDGLNEHSQREALLASIIGFCRATRDNRDFAVVVSYRDDDHEWVNVDNDDWRLFYDSSRATQQSSQKLAKQSSAALLKSKDASPRALTLAHDEQDAYPLRVQEVAIPKAATANLAEQDATAHPALRLPALSYPEIDAIWTAYTSHDKSRFRPLFTLEELGKRSRDLLVLLHSPLLLRLFLEAYAGRGLPRRISRKSVFDLYLKRCAKLTDDEGALLMNIGRLLLESQTQTVDLDLLYTDARTAEEVRRSDVGSPYLRLKRENILVEFQQNASDVRVGFAVEAVFEHLLGRILVEDGLVETPAKMVSVLEGAEVFPALVPACQVALAEQATCKSSNYLYYFIDAGTEHIDEIVGPVLGRLLMDSDGPQDIAQGLAESPTEYDIYAAVAAADFLHSEFEFKKELAFLEAITSLVQPSVTAAWSRLLRRVGDANKTALRYTQAATLYEACLAIDLRIYEANDAEVANTYYALGTAHHDLGQFELATEFLEKCLAIQIEAYEPGHPELAGTYLALGHVHEGLAHYERAIECFDKGLAIYVDVYSPDSPWVANAYHALGSVNRSLGRYEVAIGFLEKCLAIDVDVYGPNNPRVAGDYYTFGTMHHGLGEYEQAIACFDQCLVIEMEVWGARHLHVSMTYAHLAAVYQNLKQFEQAIDYYEKCLAIELEVRGPEHPEVAETYCCLGILNWELGRFEKALEHFEKSLEILLKVHGPQHEEVARTYGALGATYRDLKQFEQAIDHYEKCLAIDLDVHGPEHPEVAATYSSLGYFHGMLGQYEQATQLYEKYLAISIDVHGPGHQEVAYGYHQLGYIHRCMGEYERAIEFHDKCLSIQLEVFGPDHTELAPTYSAMGAAHNELGLHEMARQCHERALSIRKATLAEDDPALALSHFRLGSVLFTLDDFAAAAAHLERCVEIRVVALGDEHDEVAEARVALADAIERNTETSSLGN